MGEEVRIVGAGTVRRDDDDRVSDWEAGLPNLNDLTPLSQPLITPELASAFRISPEPSRSLLDVNRASQTTLASLRTSNNNNNNNFNNFINKSSIDETTTSATTRTNRDYVPVVMDIDDTADLTREGSDSRKCRRITDFSTAASAEEADDGSERTLKRPRLVWTPQLHKRFVDVVAHLGIKQAVPKTIMQLMNVEGLTRENVASHLQKYRLYLKRMKQGLSSEGPSPSDHLFASTPVPHSLHESPGGGGAGSGSAHGHSSGGNSSSNAHMGMPIPMHYPQPPNGGARMVPIPMIGMPVPTPGGFPGYESHHHHHHYGMMQQQRDWSGNKFGSVAPYPHNITPNDK